MNATRLREWEPGQSVRVTPPVRLLSDARPVGTRLNVVPRETAQGVDAIVLAESGLTHGLGEDVDAPVVCVAVDGEGGPVLPAVRAGVVRPAPGWSLRGGSTGDTPVAHGRAVVE